MCVEPMLLSPMACTPRSAVCRMASNEDTTVTVHYTAPLPVPLKHGEYVGFLADPTLADPSLPQLFDSRVEREVRVQNARGRAFQMPSHGFELRRWPTKVPDFEDSAAVVEAYSREAEALVSAVMHDSGIRGVRAIVVWDICMRSSGLVNEFQVGAADAQAAGRTLDRLAPVPLAHTDFFSPQDVYRRLHKRWTTPTDTLSTFMRADFAAAGLSQESDLQRSLSSRVVALNVWRSIDRHHPVRRCPLILCDPSSLSPAKELVPFQIHCPDVSFAEAHVLADGASAHRWYLYPHMDYDECLLFVTGDTSGLWPAVPHTSVEDPRTTSSDPPRTSIEARVFVIFDD